MNKGAVLLAALTCGIFVLAGTGRARAAAEFCPATVAGNFTAVDSSTYRLRLAAISGRSVSGFIRIQTKQGWFNAPFTNVALAQATKSYDDEGMTFTHSDFVSPDIVVRFPSPQVVLYGYVSQAQTKGETLLDWDKEGTVTCLPTPRDPKEKPPAKPPVLPPLSRDAVMLTAKSIDAPFTETCAEPFAPVDVLRFATFHLPVLFGHDNFTAVPAGTTAVVVAVERNGSVVDAWLWETSGTPLLDSAALDRARKTTFKPGRAFCENVPGFMLLRTEFKS
jgi:hypothetical protein